MWKYSSLFRISNFEFRIFNTQAGFTHTPKMTSRQCRRKGMPFFVSGFTLIEMLITLGIMSILAAATLTSIGQSRDQVRLNQATEQVAAFYREAQARSIGVTSININGSTSFPGFGILAAIADGATPSTFLLFPDLNNDGRISFGQMVSEAEIHPARVVDRIQLTNGVVISEIYTDTEDDILFASTIYNRPDPSITFEVSKTDYAALQQVVSGAVHICLTAPRESVYRTVSIWSTGQIATSNITDSCR